jgi:hypothetical protein
MKHIKAYKIFESEDFDIEEKINKIFNIDEDDYELVDEDGRRDIYEEDRLYNDQNQEITNKGSSVIVKKTDDNEISLSGLRSKNKNKGEASELLDKIIVIADKNRYTIKLGAFAEKGGLTQEELINFYKKKGVCFSGCNGKKKTKYTISATDFCTQITLKIKRK